MRDWWASKFALDQYKGSTPSLSVWNDMNEVGILPKRRYYKDRQVDRKKRKAIRR